MKKILQVLAIKPKGGVGAFLKNIYEDNFPYKFDILESGNKIEGQFDDFFLKRNSYIHLFPDIRYKNIIKYFICCRNFYKIHAKEYSAIHIHSTAVAYFHLYFAKKYGINVRIFHSHGDFANENIFKKLINKFFLIKILEFSTCFCACGLEAGEALFDQKDFTIIPNGINTKKFSFDINKRRSIRSSLEFKFEKLVGIVGRFDENKNQKFILEIAKKMKEDRSVKFIFFGDGKLFKDCVYIKEKNNLDNVIFMGNVTNISDYYNAMDILLLPSFKEGFSLVAIEAQCNGLPVIFSSSLAKSMDILRYNLFIDTDNKNIKKWIDSINKYSDFNINKRISSEKIISKNHSLKVSREILNKFYRRNIL